MDIDTLQRTGSSLYSCLKGISFCDCLGFSHFPPMPPPPLVHYTNTRMHRIPKLSIADHEAEILLFHAVLFDIFFVLVKGQFMLF